VSQNKQEMELRALLAEVSKQNISNIKLEDDLVRELGLDSLAGLIMLAAVEKRFNVRFPDDRLDEYRTMQQLLDGIAMREEGESS
jgi:acyl carrier protein